MPKLKINGINIEVEAGATVLEAAQFLGVPLPTLCHDDGLRAAGACRLCLVEVSLGGGNGLVSVLYGFQGQSAHAAGAPWRGRSALDAVELMDVGWNFRREHLRLQQRSHLSPMYLSSTW